MTGSHVLERLAYLEASQPLCDKNAIGMYTFSLE